MASINVNGHAGDTAQFYDSTGNDTFYAYADYNKSGTPWRACTGTAATSNSASGFGTNVGYSTNGGSDTAVFFDSPGNDTFYAYADYNNSGTAVGGHVRQLRRRLYQRGQRLRHEFAYSINGGSDTAAFFDSPGNDTFYAYADYNNSGKQSAGMVGTRRWYSNSASGFGTNLAYATNGGSDTAAFFDSPGNDTFYAYGDYNNSGSAGRHVRQLRRLFQCGQRLRHQHRLCDQRRQRYGQVLRLAGQRHVLCLRRLQQQRPTVGRHVRQLRRRLFQLGQAASAPMSDTRSTAAATRPTSSTRRATTRSMPTAITTTAANRGRHVRHYGGGYSNSANGFGTNVGYATNGGNDTADLFGSSASNPIMHFSTDLAIAELYGSNYSEKASGFQVVNAIAQGGNQHQGPRPRELPVELYGQLERWKLKACQFVAHRRQLLRGGKCLRPGSVRDTCPSASSNARRPRRPFPRGPSRFARPSPPKITCSRAGQQT